MTTAEERADLHEQATQLAYLAIRYANLSPLLTCDEWDNLADVIGKDLVELIEQKIEKVRAGIEDEHGDHGDQYVNIAKEAVVYE